ncbi:MAG: hypothetical protein P8188_06100 [Gemmatimonadota bacterium]|jgi:hypothetical protein
MSKQFLRWIPLLGGLALIACQDVPTAPDQSNIDGSRLLMEAKGAPGPPGGVGEPTAGSNLSFPTIWAEGLSKNPRGAMGTVQLGGPWWYWWGEPLEEGGDPLACAPDPDDPGRCADGTEPGSGWVKAFLQKEVANEWQAANYAATGPVDVDRMDWGDAIESVSWTLKSKVRIEATLFEDVPQPMTGYTMRHTSGHGIDEMWGVDAGHGAADALAYASDEAIVYSSCARLTIQKLLVERETLSHPDARLTWNPVTAQWDGDVVDPDPVFNGAIAPEGPSGGFGAEINIQGKVVYGMTWDVKTANDGAGDYRVTFSLADANCPTVTLNTFITDLTEIIALEEEGEVTVAAEDDAAGPEEGGTAHVQGADNLSYIDLRITLKESGKGGGGGGGGGHGGGGGGGGGGHR